MGNMFVRRRRLAASDELPLLYNRQLDSVGTHVQNLVLVLGPGPSLRTKLWILFLDFLEILNYKHFPLALGQRRQLIFDSNMLDVLVLRLRYMMDLQKIHLLLLVSLLVGSMGHI